MACSSADETIRTRLGIRSMFKAQATSVKCAPLPGELSGGPGSRRLRKVTFRSPRRDYCVRVKAVAGRSWSTGSRAQGAQATTRGSLTDVSSASARESPDQCDHQSECAGSDQVVGDGRRFAIRTASLTRRTRQHVDGKPTEDQQREERHCQACLPRSRHQEHVSSRVSAKRPHSSSRGCASPPQVPAGPTDLEIAMSSDANRAATASTPGVWLTGADLFGWQLEDGRCGSDP